MRCTYSLSLVVTGNDLLKQGLLISGEHDGSKGVFPVIHKDSLCIGECGVCLIGGNKFAHVVVPIYRCKSAPRNPVGYRLNS